MMPTDTAAGALLSLSLLLTACGSGGSDNTGSGANADRAEVASSSSAHRSVVDGGPLPDGTASCVETYSPEAARNRGFAFDGVILEIGPSVSDWGDNADLGLAGITFEVREWFAGGDADTATVDVQTVSEGTAEEGPPFTIGTRLLVSGEPRWGGAPLDAPIAWGCGFSRYHDPDTAEAWRESTSH
jgi:hypothetical protein